MSSQPQRGGNRGLDTYVGVHTRVEQFRAQHPKGRILTQIIKDEPLTVRAEVYFEENDSGIPNGVGHADEGGGMGNRGRSALEMTETAAVGRALAFCGYEVKEGIASREEVERGGRQQPRPAPAPRVEPAEDESDEAHATIDGEIMALLAVMGKKDKDLNTYAGQKYDGGQAIPWEEYKMGVKRALLAFLKEKAPKKA